MNATKKTSEWALRVQLEREELRVSELEQQNRRLTAELQQGLERNRHLLEQAHVLGKELDTHRRSACEFARQNRELYTAGCKLQASLDELAGDYKQLHRRTEELAFELQKERTLRHSPAPRPTPSGGGILN